MPQNGLVRRKSQTPEAGVPATGSALPRQERRASRVGIIDMSTFELNLRQDVATDGSSEDELESRL